jgi:hypothetical protein
VIFLTLIRHSICLISLMPVFSAANQGNLAGWAIGAALFPPDAPGWLKIPGRGVPGLGPES